jgi:polysaccharide biosynthesis transport protein
MAAVGVYIHREKPAFEAVALVQLATTTTQSTSSLAIDSSASLVNSPQVAALLSKKDPVGADVSASLNSSTNAVAIAGRSPTAEGAQASANAYANAFVAYLRAEAASQLSELSKQESAAAAALNKLNSQVTPNTSSGQENPVLQAKIATALQTYSSLLSQVNALEVAPPPAALAQLAGPGGSTLSSKSKLLSVAGLIGLIGGAAIALLRARLDNRLREVADIEAVVDLPSLAELPNDVASRKSEALPVVVRPRSLLSQSIRELRTSIQVLIEEGGTPVVLITSPGASDGKTYVTANLAVSWAMSGKRTVVVSGDMRRPRLEALLGGTRGSQGVANLVAEARREEAEWTGSSGADEYELEPGLAEADFGPMIGERTDVLRVGNERPLRRQVARALLATDTAELAVLPAGPSPKDPADVLATEEMATLIGRLREIADIVLIDSPPVLAVADAAILATYADAVVIVATVGKTTNDMLAQTAKRLIGSRANVLGVVLNRSRSLASKAYPQYYAADPEANGQG